jgi:hypothetical protein
MTEKKDILNEIAEKEAAYKLFKTSADALPPCNQADVKRNAAQSLRQKIDKLKLKLESLESTQE